MTLRLLPWTNDHGQECYLDPGDDGAAHMSRLADAMEAVQLGMGQELVGYALATLEGNPAENELRHMATCLVMSLQDAIRIADSRGDRLPAADDDDEELSERVQAAVDRESARQRIRRPPAPDADPAADADLAPGADPAADADRPFTS